MKPLLVITVLSLLFSLGYSFEESSDLPEGMKGAYEMKEGKILKVYSAEQEGANYRAYVVEWNGEEVVVSDPLGSTRLEEGNTLSFMTNRMEFMQSGREIKVLQFMVIAKPDMSQFQIDLEGEGELTKEVEALRVRAADQKKKVEVLEKRLEQKRNNELSDAEEKKLQEELEEFQNELKEQSTQMEERNSKSEQAEGFETLTIRASGSVYVLVKTKSNNDQLFRGTLSDGDNTTLEVDEPVEVLFTAGEHLVLEWKGEEMKPNTTGTAKLTLE